jgi:hypothetical protein
MAEHTHQHDQKGAELCKSHGKNKLNIIKIMENGLLNKKIYDKS